VKATQCHSFFLGVCSVGSWWWSVHHVFCNLFKHAYEVVAWHSFLFVISRGERMRKGSFEHGK
jgi:hypothetical protein